MRLVGLDTEPEAVNKREWGEHPPEERIRAGQEHSARVALVLGHGCIDCCGFTSLNEDGSRLFCSRLLREMFRGDEEKAALQGCGVPALYARVHDRERVAVTPEEIAAARRGWEETHARQVRAHI